jgi:hypothetical protein
MLIEHEYAVFMSFRLCMFAPEVATDEAEVATDGVKVATDGAEVATDGAEVATDEAGVATPGVKVATDEAEVATDSLFFSPFAVEPPEIGKRVIEGLTRLVLLKV